MGQALSQSSTALIVEDDQDQRSLLAALLEETEFEVIGCESAEAGLAVMHVKGNRVAILFTDIQLAGMMDGVELAQIVNSHRPSVSVVVISGNRHERLGDLPPNSLYMAKPWRALEVLMVAEHARVAGR
jgi:DNA-binding NtrC family response regulator